MHFDRFERRKFITLLGSAMMRSMMTSRRAILSIMLASALIPGAPLAAMAQNYPSRVIRLIVPFPPGGPTDVIARIVANSTSPVLGQTIVVENRPGGAAGTVGTRVVVSADPDGYTLLLSIVGSLTIAPALYKLDYDPLKDLAPIAIVEQNPEILTVNPAMPNSLAEFVAYAKSNPDKVNLASPGIGTLPHLLGALLQLVSNIKLTHVPYRGAGPAITDLLAGQVQVMFNNPSVVAEHLESGKLRALGVSSDTRFAMLPSVPTFVEQGYSRLSVSEWLGLLAPAGTPEAIVQKLNSAVNRAMQMPDTRESLRKLSVEPKAVTPQEFKTFMAEETRKWARVITDADIKAK
jgi:tripartite-type tricarboxylate transporter receptor subunit TctC